MISLSKNINQFKYYTLRYGFYIVRVFIDFYNIDV